MMAASSAPIIATIPCGSAIANSSTSQCVVSNIELTEEGLVPNVTLSPDEFLRMAARLRTVEGESYYFVNVEDGRWFNSHDEEIKEPPAGGREPTKEDVHIFVAVAFRYNENMSRVQVESVRFQDFHPNETGLSGSCLTSFVQ